MRLLFRTEADIFVKFARLVGSLGRNFSKKKFILRK